MTYDQSANVSAQVTKVNVCREKTVGNWEAKNINSNQVGSTDFSYAGPVDSNGKPSKATGQTTPTVANDGDTWCNANAPIIEPVIEDEEDNGKKVALCHAAGQSGTDKYTYLFISTNAVYNENAGHLNENGTPQAGHEDDFLTWEGDTTCAGYTLVCTNPDATNYDSELGINEKSDDSVCVMPSTIASASPSTSPSSNPSSTPTPSDNNSSSNNDDGGSVQGDSTGAPSGEVLGTYAATGVVQDVIMNALGSVGGLMTMAGSVLYGKKSKKRV